MIRHRNARLGIVCSPALIAAIAAVSSLSFHTTTTYGDATTGRSPSEWFRDEPPRTPGDPLTLGGNQVVSDTAPAQAQPADAAAPAAAAPAIPAAPVTPPPWAPVAQAAPAAPAPAPGSFRPQFGNWGNSYNPNAYNANSYPTAEVFTVVNAQARAATARAMCDRAETDLAIAFRDAQHDFDNWGDYRQALRDEQVAYDELVIARRKALAPLANDTKYQRLAALWQDMADQLAELRSQRPVGPGEVMAMAQIKLSYAVEMRAIEADLLNGDAGQIKNALERLVNSGAKIAALRHQYDESLRTNPAIIAARRNLEDARIAKITADAYLQGAVAASDSAVDYAYWTHRRSNSGYNVNDYGYGYGYNPVTVGIRY